MSLQDKGIQSSYRALNSKVHITYTIMTVMIFMYQHGFCFPL